MNPEIFAGLFCVLVPVGVILFAVWIFKKKKKGKSKKMVKYNSIDELLKTDLNNFDPEKYSKGKDETNISGETVKNYYDEFVSEECGVFRYLNIKVFDNGSRNYIFYVYKPNKYKRDHLRRLVDNLYFIYGKDDSGKGKWQHHEDEEIDLDEFWTGRNWYKNSPRNIRLGYDTDNGLHMSVRSK